MRLATGDRGYLKNTSAELFTLGSFVHFSLACSCPCLDGLRPCLGSGLKFSDAHAQLGASRSPPELSSEAVLVAIYKYFLVLPLNSKIKYSFSKMELFFLLSPRSQLPRSIPGPPKGYPMKSQPITQSRASFMQTDLSLSLGKHSKLQITLGTTEAITGVIS